MDSSLVRRSGLVALRALRVARNAPGAVDTHRHARDPCHQRAGRLPRAARAGFFPRRPLSDDRPRDRARDRHRPQTKAIREDEVRARRRRPIEDGLGHRREQLGPLRVAGLRAVIDDRRPLSRSPRARGRAEVRRHRLDTVRDVRRAAACHRPYRQPARREVADDRGSSATGGPQHDTIDADRHQPSYAHTTARHTQTERTSARRARAPLPTPFVDDTEPATEDAPPSSRSSACALGRDDRGVRVPAKAEPNPGPVGVGRLDRGRRAIACRAAGECSLSRRREAIVRPATRRRVELVPSASDLGSARRLPQSPDRSTPARLTGGETDSAHASGGHCHDPWAGHSFPGAARVGVESAKEPIGGGTSHVAQPVSRRRDSRCAAHGLRAWLARASWAISRR